MNDIYADYDKLKQELNEVKFKLDQLLNNPCTVTMEFRLPDAEEEYRLAKRGKDFYCSLYDIKDYIRTQLRYGITNNDVEFHLEKIRELIPTNIDE